VGANHHVGIDDLGDLFEAVPVMIEEVKKAKA